MINVELEHHMTVYHNEVDIPDESSVMSFLEMSVTQTVEVKLN